MASFVHELPKDMLIETEQKMDDYDVEKRCLVQMKGAPERILAFVIDI